MGKILRVEFKVPYRTPFEGLGLTGTWRFPLQALGCHLVCTYSNIPMQQHVRSHTRIEDLYHRNGIRIMMRVLL